MADMVEKSIIPGMVSVIMPCYNDGEFVQETIDSVLKQTYQNFEIIIINDGSDDEYTIEVLNKINHPQIKVINKENQGVALARNTGFSIAQGEYFLCLDSDDKIASTYLEKAVAVLEQNEQVGLVYCQAKMFGDMNEFWDLPPYSLKTILNDNCIFVSSVCRTKFLEQISCHRFNSNMVYSLEDWDFNLSLVEQNIEFYRLDEILFYYRQHGVRRNVESDTKKQSIRQIMINHFDLYLKNISLLHFHSKKMFFSKQIRKLEKTKQQSKKYKIELVKFWIRQQCRQCLTIIKAYLLFPIYIYKLYKKMMGEK